MTPLPCPFCGSADARVRQPLTLAGVACPRCGTEGPTRGTHYKAIAAWNDRPRERELAAERDLLREQAAERDRAFATALEAVYRKHDAEVASLRDSARLLREYLSDLAGAVLKEGSDLAFVRTALAPYLPNPSPPDQSPVESAAGGSLPPGFNLGPAESAMCGGRGPGFCRKGASCLARGRCSYMRAR